MKGAPPTPGTGFPNAVLTKKPGGDLAVQLTFPDVYEAAYRASGKGYSYYPCPPSTATCRFMPTGDSINSMYHLQKMADSNAMVLAKIQATQAAKDRMRVSHANYFGMPKPVLSQRRFANPSLGNQPGAIDSARRTMPGSTAAFRCLGEVEKRGAGENPYETKLHGGNVLRTQLGREWVAKATQARIRQLNAIDAARESGALDTGVGVRYASDEGVDSVPFAMKSQLDLVGALGQIQNALMAGDLKTMARFALEDITKATKLLARWSITADNTEFQEAIQLLDEIKESALEIADEEQIRVIAEGADPGDRRAIQRDGNIIVANVLPRIDAMRLYVIGMYKASYLSPEERKARSAALLKSSGLLRFRPQSITNSFANQLELINRTITRGGEPDPRVPIPRDGGDDDDDDDIGFDRPAEDREDDMAEERGPARFGRDQREVRARREAQRQVPGGAAAEGVAGEFGIARAAAQGMPVAQFLREPAAPVFAALPALRMRPGEEEAAVADAARIEAEMMGAVPAGAAVRPGGANAAAALQPLGAAGLGEEEAAGEEGIAAAVARGDIRDLQAFAPRSMSADAFRMGANLPQIALEAFRVAPTDADILAAIKDYEITYKTFEDMPDMTLKRFARAMEGRALELERTIGRWRAAPSVYFEEGLTDETFPKTKEGVRQLRYNVFGRGPGNPNVSVGNPTYTKMANNVIEFMNYRRARVGLPKLTLKK
jgi:hypothetical protein